MKIGLKTLSNEPRGSAWPPSARAARCPVKSGNERDLRTQLLSGEFPDRAPCVDCPGNREEGAGYGRSVCSESARLHARNNGTDNGMQLRKEELNLETLSQSRLRIVTHPHDIGIPSNQVLSSPGEHVPAPCTHRPSSHSSRV